MLPTLYNDPVLISASKIKSSLRTPECHVSLIVSVDLTSLYPSLSLFAAVVFLYLKVKETSMETIKIFKLFSVGREGPMGGSMGRWWEFSTPPPRPVKCFRKSQKNKKQP